MTGSLVLRSLSSPIELYYYLLSPPLSRKTERRGTRGGAGIVYSLARYPALGRTGRREKGRRLREEDRLCDFTSCDFAYNESLCARGECEYECIGI